MSSSTVMTAAAGDEDTEGALVGESWDEVLYLLFLARQLALTSALLETPRPGGYCGVSTILEKPLDRDELVSREGTRDPSLDELDTFR